MAKKKIKQTEQTLTSMEVAEMVEKEHSKLLRDIRRYISQMGEAKIGFTDFFTESSYLTEQGKELPCYNITKKGCEFIAHKLTGVKGTAFTARYIDRFHEMEGALREKQVADVSVDSNVIADMVGCMQSLVSAVTELQKQVLGINERMTQVSALPQYIDCSAIGISDGGKSKNPFHSERVTQERRLALLNEAVSDVAQQYGMENNQILHQLYISIEETMDVNLDEYHRIYMFQNDLKNASLVKTICSSAKLYNAAMNACKNAQLWY